MALFIDKKELLCEVLKCKKNLKDSLLNISASDKDAVRAAIYSSVSIQLSGYFEKMIDKFAYSRQFVNLDSFNIDECKQSARLDLYLYWHKFDETKYDDAFSYFTNIIKNGMLKAMKIIKPKESFRHIPLHREDNSILDIAFI